MTSGEARPGADAIALAAVCNEDYAMALAVALSSLVAAARPERRFHVYVLERGLAAATREKIERSLPVGRMIVSWVPVESARMTVLRRTLRSFDSVSIETYDRLLLAELLPPDLERVLYLDCDVVVRRDLGELWSADLGDAYLAAAAELEPGGRLVSSRRGLRLFRELGLPPELKVFNSGVMLVNLRRWREGHLALRVVTYLTECIDYVRWHDQDGLNAVIAGEWREIDARWNIAARQLGDARPAADPARDPYIVHFSGTVKPWQSGYALAARELFFEHLDHTPWAGWRPPPPRFRLVRGVAQAGLRAARKRWSEGARRARIAARRLRGLAIIHRPLRQLDARVVPEGRGELRLFMVADRASSGVRRALADALANGVDRALLALHDDRRSSGPQPADERVHVFGFDPARRTRHAALRHLLHRFGQGRWCLVLAPEETLLYPHADRLSLKDLCAQLEQEGAEALRCHVLDRPPARAAGGQRPGSGPLAAPFQDLATVAHDPLRERVFRARLRLEVAAGPTEQAAAVISRMPLLRYRPALLIADDLRAVDGAREATVRGAVLRWRDPADRARLDAGRIREDLAELERRDIIRSTSALDALAAARCQRRRTPREPAACPAGDRPGEAPAPRG